MAVLHLLVSFICFLHLLTAFIVSGSWILSQLAFGKPVSISASTCSTLKAAPGPAFYAKI